MKINRIGDVSEIVLSHKGKNVKFACSVKPFPYAPRADLQKPNRMEIVFDDTLEISTLIAMLERFKQELADYIGYWKFEGSEGERNER